MNRAKSREPRENRSLTSLRLVLGCLLSVLVLLVVSCGPSPPGDAATSTQGATVTAGHEGAAPPKEDEEPNAVTPQVVAYYIHNTIRCVSCLEIEKIAREAIEEKFANELDTGSLSWRVVNMELEENKHFITDYDLTVPSLVYSRVEGERQANWQKLDDVWELLDNPGALQQYVQNELSKCLRTR